jgi:BirA family transcriptional regulator, biotin operon repressor / biotin---[acetyl-CoA-carboxylase] ligase
MVSEPLDAAGLGRALLGRRFGVALAVVPQTGSTNRDLMETAAAGAKDGSVLIAEHQTAGRGRAGRSFESRPGLGVLLSALVAPGPSPSRAPLLSLAAGLAVCDAVEGAVPGLEVGLKWPNDVMAGFCKLSGILVESELRDGAITHAVIGIGVNVNHSADELPPGATSLSLETGQPIDRTRVVVALLVALEERLSQVDAGGDLLYDYRARCLTLGEEVRVEQSEGFVEGSALDVTESGALVVATRQGLETVAYGDVVRLREVGGR